MIRPVVETDAADLHAMEAALRADGRGQVMTLDDLEPLERFADRMLGKISDKEAWLCVERDGRLVAAGSINRYRPALLTHVAMFEVGVHPDVQGQGLGRALTTALIEAADAAGIVRLELYVRSDNERAIGLYRSLGFVHEATRERFVRLQDGTYIDDLTMVRFADS